MSVVIATPPQADRPETDIAQESVKNAPTPVHGEAAGSTALAPSVAEAADTTLLFLRVGEDEMFGDRIMERTHLFNGRVDSVKDNRVRIPTRIGSFASF